MRTFRKLFTRSRTGLHTASFAVTLMLSLLLPLLAGPTVAHATGGITNTRGDSWGTLEVAGTDPSNLAGTGVAIYSNGSQVFYTPNKPNNTVNGVVSGEEWQCVEFVNRLYLTKGWISTTWTGNGGQLYDSAPASLAKELNGSVTSLSPGDVLVLQDGGAGHAAIINTFNSSTGAIQIESQNTNVVFDSTFSFSNKTISTPGWSGYSIKGVVHHPTPPTIQGIQHLYAGTANDNIYETYWGGGNSLTTAEKASFTSPVTAVSYQLYNGVSHMYTGTSGGELYETYWGNGNALTTWQLAALNTPINAISSQITSDGVQHVYTGTDAGTVNETYWGNGNALTTWQLAGLNSPVKSLDSLVTSNGVSHVYSGTADGAVRETYWGGGNTLTTWQVAALGDRVSSMNVKLTGTGLLHVFSGTAAGNIYETYWGDGNSLTTAEKASLGSPVNSISAQIYNGVTHIYTGTNAGLAYETYWGSGNALTSWQIANLGVAITAVSSQITSDGVQHVYTGTSAGTLNETYWGNGNSLTTWQTANLGAAIAGLVCDIT